MPRFVRNAQRRFRQCPRLHHLRNSPATPNPAATSAWLNVPPAPAQSAPQYPPQGQPYPANQAFAHRQTVEPRPASSWESFISPMPLNLLPEFQPLFWDIFPRQTSAGAWGVSRVTEWQPTGLIMGYISAAAIPLILIIAAIAIPNLLRARISANEAAAASTVRTHQYCSNHLFNQLSGAWICA